MMKNSASICGASCVRTAKRLLLLSVFSLAGMRAMAQGTGAGPLTPPPPEDHNVRRIGTKPAPAEPPALPPEEIIRRFAQKEDEFLQATSNFSFRKVIRLQEIGDNGKPVSEERITIEPVETPEGRLRYKLTREGEDSLKNLRVEPEDLQEVARILAYPLLTRELPHYDIKYVGKEQVDEISCYIFQVHPKVVERAHPGFDGIVWVDDKFLEIVKTYGKLITDLGDYHSAVLPFAMFETYRENVEGKYWFPNYSRSDDVLHLKNLDIPIRIIVKWSDYKRVSPAKAEPPPPAAAPAKPAR
jgi:hypothetical protein